MKLKSLNLTNSTLHHARDVVSVNALRDAEYSRAVTPQIRQAGNRLSGLAETVYASLLA